jgi:hypothetical protein
MIECKFKYKWWRVRSINTFWIIWFYDYDYDMSEKKDRKNSIFEYY